MRQKHAKDGMKHYTARACSMSRSRVRLLLWRACVRFVRKSEEQEVLKEEQMNATEAARGGGAGRGWVVVEGGSGREGGS